MGSRLGLGAFKRYAHDTQLLYAQMNVPPGSPAHNSMRSSSSAAASLRFSSRRLRAMPLHSAGPRLPSLVISARAPLLPPSLTHLHACLVPRCLPPRPHPMAHSSAGPCLSNLVISARAQLPPSIPTSMRALSSAACLSASACAAWASSMAPWARFACARERALRWSYVLYDSHRLMYNKT